MTEFKSIQELLNALYSCIAIDDKGNAYLRTNSSGVMPDPGPGPDPGPTFTRVGGQDENSSTLYNKYLRDANLVGIHCQIYENGSGSFGVELNSSTVTTINFAGTGVGDLAFADVAVKNENGVIYLQNADTLNWIYKPDTFQIRCGHLMVIKNFNAGDYTSPNYVAPHIIIGDQRDDGYGDLCGKLSSLVNGIQDQSETIYHNLFEGMFANSPRLANVNVFYPYIIGRNIYKRMFAACPILNTANLYISDKPLMNTECISFAESIFDGCSNLSKIDYMIECAEIPAAKMFANAFNNTKITELNISNVKSISGEYKVGDLNYPLHNWLGGASKRVGIITKDRALPLTENSESGIPTNWNVVNVGDEPPAPEKPDLNVFDPNVPFCIENVGDTDTEVSYTTSNTNIQTSTDNNTWSDYTSASKITLKPSERLYIKADYNGSSTENNHFTFSGSTVQARGNIASLIRGSGDEYTKSYSSTEVGCYSTLFENCTNLVRAPELPATNMTRGCYQSMFRGCTGLTSAPRLPATNIEMYSYYGMFEGCTGLTTAPELPATLLGSNCYDSMFEGCTGLTTAPALPADRMVLGCYKAMFKGCTGLTIAPALPSTSLAEDCYAYMFDGCSDMSEPPSLQATELYPTCYAYMLRNCAKVLDIKCHATDISARDCTKGWVEGVSTTGDFYTKKDTAWLNGVNGIPSGWTRHDV